MSALIKVVFPVADGYSEGDYARLYSNGGSGEVDYSEPIESASFDLFPEGAGVHGWGHQRWYNFPWYHGDKRNLPGWYNMPWYHFPWYHGRVCIVAETEVQECGDYKFGFKLYDQLDNEQVGDQVEVDLAVHIAPPQPDRMTKESYDKDTDILVLNII